MGGKLSPIIIIVLLLVVVALSIVIFGIVTGKGGFVASDESTDTSDAQVVKPVLTLDKKEKDDNNKAVVITAKASIDDPDGISEIVLPNGETVKGEEATFEATENGKYDFTVRAVNGQVETLSIEVTEIAEPSATNPYVPSGFSVINDDVETGYVIEDEVGNQFVWVPVESGKLTRKTMLDGDYEESSTSATSLVNSVAKYYGFYVGRFEASEYQVDGDIIAASMQGKVPLVNVTYQKALEYANASAEAFGYEDCSTSLMNSYAWDTTLEWIDKTYENYSTSQNYGNYTGTVYPTGTTESDMVNYIADLAGNVGEWTTEVYKKAATDSKDKSTSVLRVVRGGRANLKRTPSSNIGYDENMSDTYWGFRLILFQN